MGIDPPFDSGLVIYSEPAPPSPRGVDRRNIAIIGAPDSGKSTLRERAEHEH